MLVLFVSLTFAAQSGSVTPPPVCPKCGLILRSGKESCCARGGSWFGNCGADGEHTWSQGFLACRARSRAVVDQQLRAAHQIRNGSSDDADTFINFGPPITAINAIVSTPANKPVEVLGRTPIAEAANMSVNPSITTSIYTVAGMLSLTSSGYDFGTKSFTATTTAAT